MSSSLIGLTFHSVTKLTGTLLLIVLLVGCATRQVNPRLEAVNYDKPYSIERNDQDVKQSESLVILAFSGGGTRAAAFS